MEQYQYVEGFQRFHTGLRLRCAACLSLQVLLFEYIFFSLWHIRLVLYSKWKSSITAPPPLTTISPSKWDSTLLRAFLLLLKFEHQSFVLNRRFLTFIFNFFKIFMRHYWAAHIHFQSSNIFTWKKEKPYAGKLKKFSCPRGESKLMTSKF